MFQDKLKSFRWIRFPRFFGRPGLPLGNGGNSYIAESLRKLHMMVSWGYCKTSSISGLLVYVSSVKEQWYLPVFQQSITSTIRLPTNPSFVLSFVHIQVSYRNRCIADKRSFSFMWALLGYSALHRYRERQAHFVKLLESSCKPISPFVGGVRTARYRFVPKGRPIIAI